MRALDFLYNLLAATPEPEVDPNVWYSPGAVGFIATFLVVGGAIVIIIDMVRRVRRVRYRAEIQERLANEAKGDAAEGKKKPERPKPPTKPGRVEPPADSEG